MLLPFEHSLWNNCKGGSNTFTRFAWNCLSILPIKSPQTVVAARFFIVYAVLFHRTRQVITMSKRVDINKDTIQSVRERNNKQFSFHQTLNFLSGHLVEMAQKEVIDSSSSGATRSITSFEQQNASRYKPCFAKKRFKVDHYILGALGATGASPFGPGKRKKTAWRSTITTGSTNIVPTNALDAP